MKSSIVNVGILAIALVAVVCLMGCIMQPAQNTSEGKLTIIIKDIGFPNVISLEPTITEVQLKTQEGNWMTVWSDANGQSMKLTPDGAEIVLDKIKLDAGTYIETRLNVSKINVVVDVNKDGDILDKNEQLIFTEAEFDQLPHGEKPSPPSAPSAPSQPSAPSMPDTPSMPSKPQHPSAPSDAGTGEPGAPEIKPDKPAEPAKPDEPSRPDQPASPSGMTRPLPYGVLKIENGLVYMDRFLDEIHTAEPPYYDGIHNDTFLYPTLDSAFVYDGEGGKIIYDFSLHPLLPKHEQVTVNVTFIPIIVVNTPAAYLSGMTITPSSVRGGSPVTGTVQLSGPAPEGGSVVALSSSYGGLTFLSTVIVPAGETNASFNIGTQVTNFPVNATIIASYNGATIYSELSVTTNPAYISALLLRPSLVAGGKVLVGTVALGGTAPPGGQVVNISYVVMGPPNKTYMSIPSSVTVQAGVKESSFNITTFNVTTPVDITVSAKIGTAGQSARLTLTPR